MFLYVTIYLLTIDHEAKIVIVDKPLVQSAIQLNNPLMMPAKWLNKLLVLPAILYAVDCFL